MTKKRKVFKWMKKAHPVSREIHFKITNRELFHHLFLMGFRQLISVVKIKQIDSHFDNIRNRSSSTLWSVYHPRHCQRFFRCAQKRFIPGAGTDLWMARHSPFVFSYLCLRLRRSFNQNEGDNNTSRTIDRAGFNSEASSVASNWFSPNEIPRKQISISALDLSPGSTFRFQPT